MEPFNWDGFLVFLVWTAVITIIIIVVGAIYELAVYQNDYLNKCNKKRDKSFCSFLWDIAKFLGLVAVIVACMVFVFRKPLATTISINGNVFETIVADKKQGSNTITFTDVNVWRSGIGWVEDNNLYDSDAYPKTPRFESGETEDLTDDCCRRGMISNGIRVCLESCK